MEWTREEIGIALGCKAKGLTAKETCQVLKQKGFAPRSIWSIYGLMKRDLDIPAATEINAKLTPEEVKDLAVRCRALVLSDHHYGKIILGDKGEHLYNASITEDCLAKIPKEVMKLEKYDRCEDMLLILGGDMVDGEMIFPGHATKIDRGAFQQASEVAMLYWALILAFAEKYRRVTVRAKCGNHGRKHKDAYAVSNWDNVIYQQLKILAETSGLKNVEFDFYTGERDAYVFDHAGYKWLVRHKAVPHARTNARRGTVASWFLQYQCDVLVGCHFHTPGLDDLDGRPIVLNGALPEPGDHADAIGRFSPPRQTTWVITDEKPVTNFNTIDFF